MRKTEVRRSCFTCGHTARVEQSRGQKQSDSKLFAPMDCPAGLSDATLCILTAEMMALWSGRPHRHGGGGSVTAEGLGGMLSREVPVRDGVC